MFDIVRELTSTKMDKTAKSEALERIVGEGMLLYIDIYTNVKYPYISIVLNIFVLVCSEISWPFR